MGSILSFSHLYTNIHIELVNIIKEYITIVNELQNTINDELKLRHEYKFAIFNLEEITTKLKLIHIKKCSLINNEKLVFEDIRKIMQRFLTIKEPFKNESLKNLYISFKQIEKSKNQISFNYNSDEIKSFITLSDIYIYSDKLPVEFLPDLD